MIHDQCSFCPSKNDLLKIYHPKTKRMYVSICDKCYEQLKILYTKKYHNYYFLYEMTARKVRKDSCKEKKWYNPV